MQNYNGKHYAKDAKELCHGFFVKNSFQFLFVFSSNPKQSSSIGFVAFVATFNSWKCALVDCKPEPLCKLFVRFCFILLFAFSLSMEWHILMPQRQNICNSRKHFAQINRDNCWNFSEITSAHSAINLYSHTAKLNLIHCRAYEIVCIITNIFSIIVTE